MSDDGHEQQSPLYLHVMPRHNGALRWNAFLVCDDPPAVSLDSSVTSFKEARERAQREKRGLRFASQAWRQMVAAGLAPERPPNSVTIV